MSLGVPASGLEVNLNGPGPTPFTREGLSGRKALPSLIKSLCRARRCTGWASRRVGGGSEACLLRLSHSLLRISTLELCNQRAPNVKAGPSVGDNALLQRVADHVLRCFYPAALEAEEDEGMRRTRAFTASWCLPSRSAPPHWSHSGWWPVGCMAR